MERIDDARLSKSQVDKIGDRLRAGELNAEVLRCLEEFRSEFSGPYSYVEYILTKKLFCKVTGRPAKSTLAIIEKLKRLDSRLSQIQDIAGCRVIVNTLIEQDSVVSGACQWFQKIKVDDKRERPAHGYRAVHLLVTHNGKIVEIQIRTQVQHFWANMSEKLADLFGQEIKYGQGDPLILKFLADFSEESARFDKLIRKRNALQSRFQQADNGGDSKLRRGLRREHENFDYHVRQSMYRARVLFKEIEGRLSETEV